LRDIYKTHHPEVLRLFLISSHYRSPIDFSEKNIEDAEKVLTRFYEGLENAETALTKIGAKSVVEDHPNIRRSPFMQKFEDAMNDDFNTAVVLAHMNEEVRELNKWCQDTALDSAENIAVRLTALKQAGQVLGLFARSPKEFEAEIFALKNQQRGLDKEKIEALITARELARKSKQWAEADHCRDQLTEMGVVIEDTAQGTEWKIK
jgi:cysteinyl-tRNA synthetase